MSEPKKGWGDGDKVREFNARRRRNPANTYTGFRPRVENEGAYMVIRQWCDDPAVNLSFSALINALLPGLKAACEHTTERDANGRVSIDLNLGRVEIV